MHGRRHGRGAGGVVAAEGGRAAWAVQVRRPVLQGCGRSCVTRRKIQTPGTAKENLIPKPQKTNNIYNQPKPPSIGTTHRPSNRHHQKSSPRFESQNTIQHSNLRRSSRRCNRVIARVISANAARCIGRPGHTTTQPSPAPAGTRSTPLLGGTLSGGAGEQPRTHDQPLGRGRWEGGDEGKGVRGRGGYSAADQEAGLGYKCRSCVTAGLREAAITTLGHGCKGLTLNIVLAHNPVGVSM